VVGVLKNQETFDAEVARAEGRQPRAYHGLFASHPDNDTRLREVVGAAERLRQENARTAPEDFLRRVDRMTYGDSRAQGFVRDNHFLHPALGLAMRFPPGWRVQNRPRNVVATSPRGDALIDLRAAGPAQGAPADVLRRYVKLPFGAPVRPFSLGGLPAAVTTAAPGGAPTRVVSVFLGDAAYLIGAQARNGAAFDRYRGEIDATLASFRALTAAEAAAARPRAVRVITAPAGLTFAELARRAPLGAHAEGHLRVLNGMYPSGEPAAGQAVKIVE
jgi:predicted Zn-dependent protease